MRLCLLHGRLRRVRPVLALVLWMLGGGLLLQAGQGRLVRLADVVAQASQQLVELVDLDERRGGAALEPEVCFVELTLRLVEGLGCAAR